MGSPDASVFDSTLTEETTLSFTDSDFYLNLDDVDIGPQIGQGSFSKVYLGRYLGELVAVKKQARNEADLEAYLMRELAVLKHYQHENLLQYIGASNEAASEPGGHSYVFIVTELACGGDLLALLLSEGEVGWKLRVSILTDTARALEFLHRKSLIHRDIKSPNILLDKNHRCKIADFGMTRQLGPNMTVVGTDAYMAPELMFDNPYGTSADMFSFGIVLWETIYRQKAGTEEFIDRRMADGYEVDVQALQDEAPRDANASLVALARELIEQEPDQRPTAEDTLLWLEDLSDVLPDDERAPREPIDYEALFPLDVRKRGGRQKRVAEPKETAVPPAQSPMAPPAPLAASPVAPPVAPLAPSPVVTSSAVPSPAMRLPPKSASRSSGMLAGDTPEPASALARAREGTSALPPGVPVDAGYVGRRSTMDTLGFGDGGKIANAAVMKRAASLQRLMPNDSSGDSDDYSDFEMEYMGMNEMFSGNAVPSFSYSHCAPASRAFHRVPESCTHFLFAGCIQGVLRHSHVDAASGSGVYGNVGGFHGGGGGDRGRRPLSGGKASSGGSGGGGVAHPMMGPMHPRTLSSSPSSQGTLGAVPGKGTGGGAGGWGGGGGGTSSATSASPSSNTSSFMGKLVGASHAPITRQGYLHKKGKSGLRNWQKRWFVLEGSKLIWYKDSKSYPREPRGFLELKGCFLAKGENFSWKILSADASAEQDDYNREIATNEAGDMESWLTSLQEAIDGADTGEGPAGVKLPVLKGEEETFDSSLFRAASEGFKTDVTVDAWLNSLGLGHLAEAFARADYKDCLMIQEMGLTDEDLAYIGVTNPAHRKALKLAARGLVELMLQVEISAFFNFHSELVYRLDSRWRYLRATTYFEFSDFEDLHRRLKGAMKETKFYKMMPPLPQRPGDARGRRIGSIDHARQMARVQQELNMYTQKLVMLVGTKEPFFTVLCGMLDLIPPDPSRLPVKDEFFMQVQSRVQSAAARGVGGGADLGRASRRTPKRDVAREDRGGGRVGAGAGVRAGAGGGAGAGAGGANAGGANGRVGWSVGAGEGQPPTFVTSTSSHSSSKSKRLSGARTNRHGVKASPMSKSSSSSSSSRPS